MDQNQITQTDAAGVGLNLFGQCIDFKVDEKLEDTFVTFKMNIMDICYSVQVPKHEMDDINNVRSAWKQLIQDFGIRHLLGQSKVIQSGNRDLTDEEIKAQEKQKKKSGLVLL